MIAQLIKIGKSVHCSTRHALQKFFLQNRANKTKIMVEYLVIPTGEKMAKTDNIGKLSLTGDLSVSDAEKIHEYMSALLKEFSTVCINFSSLEDFDASIIQLLFALCRQAKTENKKVTFEGTFSESVRKRLYATGLITAKDAEDSVIIVQLTDRMLNK